MKVEQLNSRRLFGEFGPRAPEVPPEGFKILARVALTLWLPAIALCLIINTSVVLFGMIAQQILGTLWGILIYKYSSTRFPSCVPVHHSPNIPVPELKKAA